jgi:hypothetical protein
MPQYNHTPDDGAFYMALALAAKQDNVTTPEQLLAKIDEYLPVCARLIHDRLKAQQYAPSASSSMSD